MGLPVMSGCLPAVRRLQAGPAPAPAVATAPRAAELPLAGRRFPAGQFHASLRWVNKGASTGASFSDLCSGARHGSLTARCMTGTINIAIDFL